MKKLKQNITNHNFSRKPLKDIVYKKITKGTTPTTIGFNFEKNGVNFLKVENLKNNKITENRLFISEKCNIKMKRSQLKENDILFSIAGTIGNTAIVKKQSLPANINQAIAIISVGKEHIPEFINYNLIWEKNNLKKYTVGGVIFNYNLETLENLQILTPNTETQKNITEVLFQQESLINEMEELIELYEKRLRYTSNELLSGRLRVKEVDGETILYKNEKWKTVKVNGKDVDIPSDWNVKKFEELNCEIKTGKKDANYSTKDGQYNFFTCSQETLKCPNYSFDCKAILLAGNGNVGEVKIYDGKFDAYQRTYVISNEKQNMDFLYYYFKNFFKKNLNISGGVIPFIKMGDIQKFIIYEATKNEQKLIAETLRQQEDLIKEQKELLELEKKRFTWLLDNLLSGKYIIEDFDENEINDEEVEASTDVKESQEEVN